VARTRPHDHVTVLKISPSPPTSHLPLMDTSERNAAYRFNTKVRCDCGCKIKVLIRTQNRHREKLARAQPGSEGDNSTANSDVKMLEDSSVSDSAPQDAPDLQDSEVANANANSVPPKATTTFDDNPRAMDLDNNSAMLQDHLEHNSAIEEHLSEAPSSPGDWYNIGTPPPSPPRSPLVRSEWSN
jgi:hypothetical protein